MISREFSHSCPKCESVASTLINREYFVITSGFRKFTRSMLVETQKCNECGLVWFNYFVFLRSRRSDWLFSFPILKCPICGGDNFEIDWDNKGSDTHQCLQFRCIENDDFVWVEEYEFSYRRVPEKDELDLLHQTCPLNVLVKNRNNTEKSKENQDTR